MSSSPTQPVDGSRSESNRTLTESPSRRRDRFASVTATVMKPLSSFEIVTPVISGAPPPSPAGSTKERLADAYGRQPAAAGAPPATAAPGGGPRRGRRRPGGRPQAVPSRRP